MFKEQLPYVTRINTPSKEPGSSLGPFADSQMKGKEFLNTWLAKLRDSNQLPAEKYGPFKEDLDLVEKGNQVLPNTGKDPFLHSGPEYLNSFLKNYDNSQVVGPDERVDPRGLSSYVQQRAEKGTEFPGSEGTAIS